MSKKLVPCLIIPDTHIPFHHVKAYKLMLKIAAQVKVQAIVILGDYLDFYAVSSHDKYPYMERLLSRELEKGNEALDELDSIFPRAKKIFIQGNHEWRLERYINKNAPELFGLVDTKTLLKLDTRKNWEYYKYEPAQFVQILDSKLYARHEPLSGGYMPSHHTVMKAGCSIVHGHTHTSQQSQVVMANGDTHIGISVGWLGDKKHSAFHYVRGHHQWPIGFGLCYIMSNGNFCIDAIRVIDNKAIVHGKIYE